MSDGTTVRGGSPVGTGDPTEQDRPARLPDAIVDAAIRWVVRLDHNRPDAVTREAFARWLAADPRHAEAWQRVGTLTGDFADLPPPLAMRTLQAVESARRTRGTLASPGRRSATKLLSFAAVGIMTGWAAREHTPWQRLLADASTAIGEQKTLHLDDGTTIVLNSDSAISTDLAGANRLVVLRRGEILVSTGADAEALALLGHKRRFWVHTPFGNAEALGTRFVVRLENERARISVQEGAVELHPAQGGMPAIVRPGESRWLMMEGTLPAEPQGFEADGWAEGVIACKNIRLEDLLAELSRYRTGRIVCDPRVADLRLSGLFHIKETDRVLQFLAQTQPLDVTYRTRFWVSVGPEETP